MNIKKNGTITLTASANMKVMLNLLPMKARLGDSDLSGIKIDQEGGIQQYKSLKQWIINKKEALLQLDAKEGTAHTRTIILVTNADGRDNREKGAPRNSMTPTGGWGLQGL